jgi:23S rRNA (pseudouridine1915-N3)-methyltransferase
MRIVVAAIGRLKAGPDRELAERYRDRAGKLGRTLGVRSVEIIEVRESRAREAGRRVTEEAIALASIVAEGAAMVLLDGRGENISSDALAGRVRGWRDGARETVCFIIGGADGLGPALRDRADLVLAFGSATWPHQLVRIMLLEQIYRTMTILSGHPYHRE